MQTDPGPDIGSDVAAAGTRGGSMMLAISNAIVQLYKQHFGKGPTKARTYYDRDVITCVLQDVYTRAEQTLLDSGRSATVLHQRQELQQAVREKFVGAIESISGRKVIAFFSGNQPAPDIAVEVFVLLPEDGSGTDGAGPPP